MSRKTEQEFIEEGFSADELAAMNGDTIASETAVATETSQEPAQVDAQAGAGTEAVADGATVETPPVAEPEPKMVDVRALQEARAEIRKRDEALARSAADQARLDERIKLINEAIAAQNKPAEAAVPTEEDDPFGYMQHKLSATEKKLQELEEFNKKQAEERTAAVQHQAVIDRADMTLGQARAIHADLDDALTFATTSVQKEIARRLTAQGLTGEQFVQTANQMYQATLTNYARDCPTDPDEAAEHIRRHARYWGWTGPQQQAAAEAQPAIQQVQKPTIEQRAEQQERHQSLSGIQGGAAPAKLDAKALAAMSDDQYNELLRTVAGRKQLEAEFGGV